MATGFQTTSASYLRDVYLPRLTTALETLPADDLWWRPHAACISFGTILMHLEGNVRQWILGGLGGAPDHRDRDREFAATAGPDGAALLARLADTVRAAAEIIESLDEQALRQRLLIQGHELAGDEALYHVVEHFSWHTGQAVWIAKARAGADHGLGFYDDAELHEAAGGGDAPAAP